MKNTPNILINQIKAINNGSDVASQISSLIHQHSTSINSKKNIIRDLNNSLDTVNDFFNTINDQNLFNKYASAIKQTINNGQDVQPIITDASNFNQALISLKDFINGFITFQTTNQFENIPTSQKQSYTNLINEIKTRITNLNSLSINQLNDWISNLNILKSTIETNHQWYIQQQTLISSNNILYPNQKTLLLHQLKEVHIKAQPDKNQFVQLLTNLINLGLPSKIHLLNHLNQAQLTHLNNTLQNSINIEQISNLLEEYTSLNSTMSNTQTIFSSFADYQTKKGYQLLTVEDQNALNETYNNLQHALVSNSYEEELINYQNQLSRFTHILTSNPLEHLQQEIVNNNHLYQWEKNNLVNQISNISNYSNWQAVKNTLTNWIDRNYQQNDLTYYNSFTPIQKLNLIKIFNGADNEETYNTLKNKYNELVQLLNKIKQNLLVDQDYSNNEYYTLNDANIQNDLNTHYQSLQQVIGTSLDADLIQTNYNDWNNIKQSAHDALVAKKARTKALADYHNIVNQLITLKNQYTINSERYASLITEINNAINHHNSIISSEHTNTLDIKESVDKLITLKNKLANQQISLDQQAALKAAEQNFYTQASRTNYSIADNLKNTVLPSEIDANQLIPPVLSDNWNVEHLVLIPDNETGSLTLRYSLGFQGFKKIKTQIISGFLTTQDMNNHKKLNDLRAQYETINNEINQFITEHQTHFANITNVLSASIVKYDHNHIENNIDWLKNAINQLTNLLEEAYHNLQQIINQQNIYKQTIKAKIQAYNQQLAPFITKQIFSSSITQWQTTISNVLKQINSTDLVISNLEQISDEIDNNFNELINNLENQKTEIINNQIPLISIKIINPDQPINTITSNDLTIKSNLEDLDIKVDDINADIMNNTLNVTVHLNYLNTHVKHTFNIVLPKNQKTSAHKKQQLEQPNKTNSYDNPATKLNEQDQENNIENQPDFPAPQPTAIPDTNHSESKKQGNQEVKNPNESIKTSIPTDYIQQPLGPLNPQPIQPSDNPLIRQYDLLINQIETTINTNYQNWAQNKINKLYGLLKQVKATKNLINQSDGEQPKNKLQNYNNQYDKIIKNTAVLSTKKEHNNNAFWAIIVIPILGIILIPLIIYLTKKHKKTNNKNS
ncbi:lipoprotein 17-related variable surface protein [Ureaplasma sp. ES3154-GEN]|uniref:lipoprotein 17-related variable surface protein n=1 Tax=Ureaplasma sp. ES3154-GEN TaxID=2984844 RepID=UPI0021E80EF0|nr:lipoprotein 17-related variable surface protein [Ureaplasma sp. ES3154-GEN]MCV3743551.1 lipoprotein 17-related variable surface protein [Ureaplasma sp. ES3154-GEN]